LKIKNQLIIIIVAFIVILVIINLSILYTDQQATILSNDQAIASKIEKGVSNLNHVADFYYLYQQVSQLSDWQSNITALNGYVTELNSTDNNRTEISNKLLTDIQAVDNAFNYSASYLQKTSRNEALRTNPEFQAIYGGLSDQLQNLSNDSSELSQTLTQQDDILERANIDLIITSLIAFALFLIASYYIMFRRTLKSISEIEKGVKVIATGNFDYSVKTNTNDELEDLSESINQMTIQLKSITTKLKEQERMAAIGQTAGMVGHDLRNPLQALIGQAYLLEDELGSLPNGQSKENLKESIQVISEQISYMNKIVSDLQTFVKPVEAKKEQVNIKQLISNVMIGIEIPNGIELQTRVQDSLTVNADPQLLKRVLINLISNAVQAMSNGGTLTITGLIASDGKVLLTVKDTGVGIPEDIKPKIFTPLFTTKSRGQGFGLAVCKRVIEAQGGTITFESQEGKGTEFIIELPSRQPL
jgi:signal transduction histidine kinase